MLVMSSIINDYVEISEIQLWKIKFLNILKSKFNAHMHFIYFCQIMH